MEEKSLEEFLNLDRNFTTKLPSQSKTLLKTLNVTFLKDTVFVIYSLMFYLLIPKFAELYERNFGDLNFINEFNLTVEKWLKSLEKYKNNEIEANKFNKETKNLANKFMEVFDKSKKIKNLILEFQKSEEKKSKIEVMGMYTLCFIKEKVLTILKFAITNLFVWTIILPIIGSNLTLPEHTKAYIDDVQTLINAGKEYFPYVMRSFEELYKYFGSIYFVSSSESPLGQTRAGANQEEIVSKFIQLSQGLYKNFFGSGSSTQQVFEHGLISSVINNIIEKMLSVPGIFLATSTFLNGVGICVKCIVENVKSLLKGMKGVGTGYLDNLTRGQNLEQKYNCILNPKSKGISFNYRCIQVEKGEEGEFKTKRKCERICLERNIKRKKKREQEQIKRKKKREQEQKYNCILNPKSKGISFNYRCIQVEKGEEGEFKTKRKCERICLERNIKRKKKREQEQKKLKHRKKILELAKAATNQKGAGDK